MDAAAYADANGLWVGNKAEVFVQNGPVGIPGRSGELTDWLNIHGATSKSQDIQAVELPGGGYRMQFFSPANNPGYGKLYVQEIDGVGQVLREWKDTMGPDGLIERKWVHGGP